MIEVVVGIIKNQQNKILFSSRNHKNILEDFWELPGGKVEVGETEEQTLTRELQEELDIKIKNFTKIISTFHKYKTGLVKVHSFLIKDWFGQIKAKENQTIIWLNDLKNKKLLPTTIPILNALNFSNKYLITPSDCCLDYLEKLLNRYQNLFIQYRDTKSNQHQYLQNAKKLIKIAHKNNHKILLTTESQIAKNLGSDGVHWNSKKLLKQLEKPKNILVSASCHNEKEINKANNLNVDMVLLSPVGKTNSHKSLKHFLTWHGFEKFADICAMPCYALGGVGLNEVTKVKKLGGQGVAGISTFFNSNG